MIACAFERRRPLSLLPLLGDEPGAFTPWPRSGVRDACWQRHPWDWMLQGCFARGPHQALEIIPLLFYSGFIPLL